MKRVFLLLPLVSFFFGFGCEKHVFETKNANVNLLPIQRNLVGLPTDLPAFTSEHLVELKSVFQDTRTTRLFAWKVLAEIVTSVPWVEAKVSSPRFLTWYAKDDLERSLQYLLNSYGNPKEDLTSKYGSEQVDEALNWNLSMAKTLPTWSLRRFENQKNDVESASASPHLTRDTRVLVNPILARHLLGQSLNVSTCFNSPALIPAADNDKESSLNFSSCFDQEAPVGSVAIKMRWLSKSQVVASFDTSPQGLNSALKAGEWKSSRVVSPTSGTWFEARDPVSKEHFGLLALHVAIKLNREWTWITLWWSENPENDFGMDRHWNSNSILWPGQSTMETPNSSVGPDLVWNHYKMCVVADFESTNRGKVKRGDDLDDIESLLNFNLGSESWCSNPYLELGARNATTNCIGCHQHAGTDVSTSEILNRPELYSLSARKKTRKNFPADYLWLLNREVDLSSAFQKHFDLVPPSISFNKK